MFPKTLLVRPAKHLVPVAMVLVVLLALSAGPLATFAVAQQQSQQQPPPPDQPGSKDAQESNPSSGGPQGDVGPIAVPKKKDEAEQPPEKKKEEKFKNPAGMPDFSVRVDVPSVDVDVTVLTREGGFVPNLKKDNFRILEDGVPQQVTTFNQGEAPITAVLLVEFAATNYNFIYDMLNGAYTFASGLKPNDWIAVVSYDMKP